MSSAAITPASPQGSGSAGTSTVASTVILVGNPNVGKSVLFSKLTGKFVVIANYPGTTVEVTRGEMILEGVTYAVIDSPGVNELAPRTEDWRVTCEVLREHPEATVVQVADAKNLRRALLLTQQLAQQQRRVLLVLNMMDELDQCGGKIDVRKLSELLGIPVVPTIATANTGIHLVQKSLPQAAVPRFTPLTSVRRGSPDPAVCADRQVSEQMPEDLRSAEVRGLETGAQRRSEAEVRGLETGAQRRSEAEVRGPETGAQRRSEAEVRGPETGAQQRSAGAQQSAADPLPVINELLAQCYSHVRPRHASFAQKLGWWATHPLKGLGLLALALYLTFWFVGLLGAGTAVDLLETGFFNRHFGPWAIRVVDALLPFPHQHQHADSELAVELPLTPAHAIELWGNTRQVTTTGYELTGPDRPVARFLHDFLVGDYGMLTMALSYGFAIVLPIVTTFFLLFGILEDSGYLPRLAVMVNRLFRAMGLNGKAVLPMVLGLGCDTMATMTTRILETRKERMITTLLLALAVPCSAQLGVLLAMMASISAAAAGFWFLLMVGVTFLVGWLAARLYGGQTSDFILELPPMRRPLLGNVAVKTFARLKWYLIEVIPLFVAGTALLFFLDKLRWLDKIAHWGEPLVKGWLGLPAETAQAFLVGFLRRDYGAVFLLDASKSGLLNSHQVLVAMVTITLFMPCIATLFMIARELGRKAALAILVFVFFFAFLVGGLVDKTVHLLGL